MKYVFNFLLSVYIKNDMIYETIMDAVISQNVRRR